MLPSLPTSGGQAAVQNASLNKPILTLAIPAIVANITTPLLSLVDIAIVGHLGSAAFVGAIAVGGSLFNMLYWLFGFLRFGTSGLTAQAVGANDSAGRTLVALRALLIAIGFGVALILLQLPIGKLALNLMDPDTTTRQLAGLYFSTLIWGAPAVLVQYALTGWFVGSQDTRTPMFISLAINVINIGASLLLVYVFELGIRGVALGTLIAQWSGCLLALAKARLKPRPLRQILNRSEMRRFFGVNVSIFLRTVCLIAVTVWFTRAGARQGEIILAVNTLLLQLFTLFSYFMDGFAFAAEALCGKLYGAGNRDGLKRMIRRFMSWGGAVALLFTALYAVGGAEFLRLLTNDDTVLNAAGEFRLWGIAIPLAGFMAFTWDGIVIGLTKTRLMLISMAVATAIFFALWALLEPLLGNHALWLAFIAYLLTRGILLALLVRP